MKPIIEPDDRESASGDAQGSAASSTSSSPLGQGGDSVGTRHHDEKPSGSWLVKAAGLLFLVGIAVLGFGSSAGWFDTWLNQSKQPLQLTSETAEQDVADADISLDDTGITASDTKAVPASKELGTGGSPMVDGGKVETNDGQQPELATPLPLRPLAPETSVDLIQEGHEVAEHLVKVMPGAIEAREMQARFEYEFGDIEKARSIWESILEENPNFVFALRGLGDVCTTNGELKEAVKYFRRAVLVDPNNLSRQVTLGIALLHATEVEEAERVLKAVLSKSPNHIGAHVELGSVLTQLQKYEEASEHFEAALEADSELPEVHFGLATCYARLGDREKAAHHRSEYKRLQGSVKEERESGRRSYDDLEAIRIDVGTMYVDMARVYLTGGYTDTAELLLLRAADMNPRDIEPRQALAFIALQRGKTFDAIRWLNEVSELKPKEFSYSYEIARLYMSLQQPKDAESALVQFTERNPDNAEGPLALARFYLEALPKPDLAVEYAQKAVETSPAAENYALLSTAFQSAGDLQSAIDALERAIEADPSNASYIQLQALLREELIESSPQGSAPAETQPAKAGESGAPEN